MRSYLQENHIQSNEDNHKKTVELSTALSQNDLRGCFKAWMACMKLHVASEGKYFDVKNMDTINAFMNYSETHTTSVHFTIHTISEQPTKYNPKGQITITTLVDEYYDDKDDDDDTTGRTKCKIKK
jgi:hypothetical protein